MTIKYLTYNDIPKRDKDKKGIFSGVPMNAAGVPYKLYEYNPDAFPQYYGLSDRLIKKIQKPSPKVKKVQMKIQKAVYAPR